MALVTARGMSKPSEVVRSKNTKLCRLWTKPAPGTNENEVAVPAPNGQNHRLRSDP